MKKTNVHQTYNGVHGTDLLRTAVEQTRGIFLAYKGQPILAMFDACCGSVVPARIAGFDFEKVPYLARRYPCNYCKTYKVYAWQSHYSEQALIMALKRELPHLKKIKQIKIVKKDAAGLVQKVAVYTDKRVVMLSGKKIYSLLRPKVKSFYFSITHKDGTFTFTGKGIGHHLGLCQWGAREMVRQGFGYQEILSFYYPNTVFMRLR